MSEPRHLLLGPPLPRALPPGRHQARTRWPCAAQWRGASG